MLKGFVEWLEGHLIKVGVFGLAEGALAILAFGGIMSALLGTTAVKASAIVVVLLANLGTFIILLAGRRELRRRSERDQLLLGHYCRVLRDRSDFSWRVISWSEVITIKANGDSHTVVTVKAIVESVLLDFFRLCLGAIWNQPHRYRRQVKVNARSLEVDGIGGTRYEVTTSWMPDGRLEFLTHFKSPLNLGEKIELVLELEWPGKCVPLVRYREPEEFRVHFRNRVEFAHYVVVLPDGMEAYCQPIGFVPGENRNVISSGRNRAGQQEISFTAYDIPAREVVGMRLDLK